MPTTAPTLTLLTQAYQWQQSILPIEQTGGRGAGDTPVSWIRAPFYDGAMALYSVNHDPRLLRQMFELAQANHFELGSRHRRQTAPQADSRSQDTSTEPDDRFADDLAVGQFYVELYRAKHDPAIIAPLKARLDHILAEPPVPGRQDWWWCDALFMAPPTFSHLFTVTGDRRYLDFADKQFWDTTAFLYDPQQHLFFRDQTYFHRKEPNGQPVFWSRGNGWVLAGIARILDDLPADYPTRGKYITLYTEMARRIASLQQPDGFWRVSLLDPAAHPGGETSGTGFYCYALAWGIRHDLLPREPFLPVVTKAWAALTTAVDPATGRVGWVQPIGAAPATVKPTDIAEYGTGAFLLAGCEVMKLEALNANPNEQGAKPRSTPNPQ